MKSAFSILISAMFLANGLTAKAQFIEVDIGSQLNVNLRQYTGGNNYQLGGTQLVIDGVPFGLAELNNNTNTTGIIQSVGAGQSPTNSGGFANPDTTGAFDYIFPLPAGIQATALYCLMNSGYGTTGTDVASIVVTGDNGETASLSLVEGVNIRDHFNDGYEDDLSDSTVIPTYFQNGAPAASGSDRLDCQTLVLPETFTGDAIASISFQGFAYGDSGGSAFLAGLTLRSTNFAVPGIPTLGFGVPLWSINGLNLILQGPVGTNYEIDASTDLVTWSPVTNFIGTITPFYFSVPSATNSGRGFYRAKMQ